ncbi:MAG: zinc-dependent alcohol dehydrogenase family protein [Candidatus Micrarchaeia archaeon]
MKAMVLHKPDRIENKPLKLENVELRKIIDSELLVKVVACGVCRTDLHIVEGDLKPMKDKIIPGHEIVGKVVEAGKQAENFSEGDLVGIPWLHSTCGRCEYCVSGRENLCPNKTFTGYDENGGYAEYAIGNAAYTFKLGNGINPFETAPLLCAGIIGYRAFKIAKPSPGGTIAMFGFGSSAHVTMQLAKALGYKTVVVSRSEEHIELAKRLGADEAYTYKELPGIKTGVDGAIVFAPSGDVIVNALAAVKKGATVAVADIYSTDIPKMNYERYIFGEKKLIAVEANTRQDAVEYLGLAERLKIKPVIETLALERANEALLKVKQGVNGSVVLKT